MEWIVILVCLGLNALLAAAEMSFVTVTRSQIKELVKTGKASATVLLALRENPERTLSVMQVGIGMVGALAAAVGGVEAHQKIAPYFIAKFALSPQVGNFLSVATVVIPLTFVNVIFAELVPKTLALRNPIK